MDFKETTVYNIVFIDPIEKTKRGYGNLLADKGWTTEIIAQEVRISLKDTDLVLKRYTKEDMESKEYVLSDNPKVFRCSRKTGAKWMLLYSTTQNHFLVK